MPKVSKRASAQVSKLTPAVRLVNPKDSVNQDYVESIRALLRRAESGESTGLAYVETLHTKNKKSFHVDTLGMLDQSPAFCIGTLEVLKATILNKVVK